MAKPHSVTRATLVGLTLLVPIAHARDGDLDLSFGADGITVVDFGVNASSGGLALAPNGGIAIGGTVLNVASGYDFAAASLDYDGAPNTSFNGNGMTMLADGTNATFFEEAFSTMVQADGRIVVIGGGPDTDTAKDDSDFKLARFNLDGSVDTSFSGDGRSYLAFDLGGSRYDAARDALQLPDGKLVVVGVAEVAKDDADFAAVRLNTDGSPDTSFDADGRMTFSFELDSTFRSEAAQRVALDADGKLLVAGAVNKGGVLNSDFAIARLMPNGAFDASFGDDGRVTVAFDLGGSFTDRVSELIVAADGSIFVSGYIDGNGFDFGVVKLLPNGSPDPSFGSDGKATVAFDLGGFNDDMAFGAALQSDSKIILAGSAGDFNSDIALARLDVDGTLDPSFGFAGKQLIALDLGGNLGEGAERAVIQGGRLVLSGGTTTDMYMTSLFAARIIIDTLLEDSFD